MIRNDKSWGSSSPKLFAAAAKSLQSCPTLCDPIGGSHQAPPSLGFSRQEHWSGLPFPSPMHGSEKWKWSCSVMSDSSWPRGLQPTRLLHPWDFPGKSTGVPKLFTPQLNGSSECHLPFPQVVAKMNWVQYKLHNSMSSLFSCLKPD